MIESREEPVPLLFIGTRRRCCASLHTIPFLLRIFRVNIIFRFRSPLLIPPDRNELIKNKTFFEPKGSWLDDLFDFFFDAGEPCEDSRWINKAIRNDAMEADIEMLCDCLGRLNDEGENEGSTFDIFGFSWRFKNCVINVIWIIFKS